MSLLKPDHYCVHGLITKSYLQNGKKFRTSEILNLDPPILEECGKGICLCNLLRSTQPNDRETVIEGSMSRVSVKRSSIFQEPLG